MTKTMLWQEWSAGLGECIEAEAQAQAICMQTNDFERAYHAFAAKQKPVFEGNFIPQVPASSPSPSSMKATARPARDLETWARMAAAAAS
jgi:hypothetical protein